MKRLLVSLCLLGAAIYAAGALFPPPNPTSVQVRPAHSEPRQLRSWGTTLSDLPLGQKPRAQLASYQNPAPLPPQKTDAADFRPAASASASDDVEFKSVEWTKVAIAAKVHSKASVSSATVRVYRAGAELQVVSRDGGWVGVSDPVTQERGWVFEKYLVSSDGPTPMQTATRSTNESDLSEPTLAKPAVAQPEKAGPAAPAPGLAGHACLRCCCGVRRPRWAVGSKRRSSPGRVLHVRPLRRILKPAPHLSPAVHC